ncbi:MAG TPA: hypothetical protein PLG90_08950 [Ignavibacteria bacterium]|nr:hypothetical protein [Ignavibacteria bacterium]
MNDYIILYKSKKSTPVYFYVGLIFLITLAMTFYISTNPDSAKNFDSFYSYAFYVLFGVIGFVIFIIMLRPEKYILTQNKIYKHPKMNDKTANYVNVFSSTPVITLSNHQILFPGVYSIHGKKTFGTYFKLNSDLNKPVVITVMSWKPENENSYIGEKSKKTDFFMDDDGFQKFINFYNLKDNYIKIKY